jgi:hypothetical protein
MMRLYVERYLTHVASLASPGLDELRWLKPVRPGDMLWVRVTVLKTVRSKSKPDRGAVISFVEVINQTGEVVMTLKLVNIIGRWPPGILTGVALRLGQAASWRNQAPSNCSILAAVVTAGILWEGRIPSPLWR